MKSTLILVSLLFSSAFAQARTENFYILDYTGTEFVSTGFNMYGDEMLNDEYDGLALKLDGEMGKDFVVKTHATNPAERCDVVVLSKNQVQTLLKVVEDLEVDEGESCSIHVIYRDGRNAVLEIERTGT